MLHRRALGLFRRRLLEQLRSIFSGERCVVLPRFEPDRFWRAVGILLSRIVRAVDRNRIAVNWSGIVGGAQENRQCLSEPALLGNTRAVRQPRGTNSLNNREPWP